MSDSTSYRRFKEVLETAGALFAEKGYDDTTMEAVSRASGISVEEIVYRFGSKDKLYAEVFYMLIESDRLLNIDAVIREHPGWAVTRRGQSRIIGRKIRFLFESLFSEEYPWKAALMAREMNAPVLEKENQLDYIFRQIFGDLECFCRHIRPDLSESELFYCCCLPVTYANFFLLKMSLLTKQGGKKPKNRILDNLAEFTTAAILRFLGLPEDVDDTETTGSREFKALSPA